MQQHRALDTTPMESREAGQALTEYAVILGFLSVAAILALYAIGETVLGLFEQANLAF